MPWGQALAPTVLSENSIRGSYAFFWPLDTREFPAHTAAPLKQLFEHIRHPCVSRTEEVAGWLNRPSCPMDAVRLEALQQTLFGFVPCHLL